jgi:chromosome segregation ATPase
VGHASIIDEGTDDHVVLRKRTMRKIAEEQRELADRVTLLEAELQLVREERDDLLRRAEAAKAIWREVQAPPPRPMTEDP